MLSPRCLALLTLGAALLGALALIGVVGLGVWARDVVKPLSRSKVMETW